MIPKTPEPLLIRIAAHPIQVALVNLVAGKGIDDLTLRATATAINMEGAAPQKIQHHLGQLVKYGFLDIVGGKYRIGKQLLNTSPQKGRR